MVGGPGLAVAGRISRPRALWDRTVLSSIRQPSTSSRTSPGSNQTSPPYAVAGVRLARSRIRLATSLIPRPIRMNSTPIAIAMAATP